ncbi:phosphatase PAP2 family protein [Nocardioides sp. DS6]|uniref:Phosphatase PAP2 family protein n=1 Tax=Nocardioides eburneus TaxID=3231482 RepID=A0ABV3T426_9ACTN
MHDEGITSGDIAGRSVADTGSAVPGITVQPSVEHGVLPRTLWQRLAGVRAGIRELIFVTVLYIAYTSSRLLASNNMAEAKSRARQILSIERAVDLDWEHGLNQFFVHHDLIGLLGCYWYSTAHYILTLVVLVWLYARGRHRYLPARRALVVGTVLALALYLMLPTAPPRFFPHLYDDVLLLHSDQGWWGADASAPKGMGHLTNELAAFPSLHCGWSLWVAIVVWRNVRSWVVRLLAGLSAAATAIVVVGTGNHWTLDVIVGWMVVIAGVVSVSAFSQRPIVLEAASADEDHSKGRRVGEPSR